MTLRVKFEIVPHGDEERVYEIATINISNTGLVEDRGFGHQICNYEYEVLQPIPEILVENVTHEQSHTGMIGNHDRRDGAVELIRRVLESVGSL